jgi:tetratricopeptide (TPR) repeat protein
VRHCILVLLGGMALAAAGQPKQPAPLFQKLGNLQHPVTTKSKEAQKYFNQGLTLLYAFNHQEAIRSFEAAAALDADCAMAYWGVAFAYGPNINAPMADDAVPKAWQALQKALTLAARASPREQAYIQALARRYVAKPVKDRGPLDQAFADAMRQVHQKYPDDLDAATLFAEALMDTMPWDYYTAEGKARPATAELVAVLEEVLRRDPNHPGANHYYIHAVEASPNPERGLGAAYRLGSLCPDAGHLVHMPAHIFLRVGDYRAAAIANEQAIAADERYLTQCKVQGFYPAAYYSHNVHFLWYALTMEGRSRESIEAGKKTSHVIDPQALHDIPLLHWLKAVPLWALARFGKWDDILQLEGPEECDLFELAMWHYCRGLAFVRHKEAQQAQAELAALQKIATDKKIDTLALKEFPGASLIRLAARLLNAEAAMLAGQTDDALRLFEEAVKQQDALPYMEPPFWSYPIRQSLGAGLLQAGQPARAEAVYRDDLKRHPNNGWSLFGLLQALRLQGKTAEADRVQRQFRQAWKDADVTLTASVF